MHQLLRRELVDPSTGLGAAFYGLLFFCVALVVARIVRMTLLRLEQSHQVGFADRTTIGFVRQLAQTAVYLIAATLYAHLVPALRTLGTAMLAGVSIASIVIGLAAQSTLGNLVSGLGLLLYRPFEVGDHLQLNLPGGVESAVVEELTLGYTFLRTSDGRRIVAPNNIMASQVIVHLPETVDPSL